MAKQTINAGVAPTGAGGDTFRSGSAKLQANDDELYNQLGATAQGVLPAALPLTKGGTGATGASAARINLGLGTAAQGVLTTSREDTSIGRVLKVGDFGIGGSVSHTDSEVRGRTGFQALSVAATGLPYPLQGVYAGWANVISFIGVSATAKRLHFNNITPLDYTSGWAEVYHTLNTTVDSNGFVKKASPIVKLYADRIELNDEAEQQDIVFEKLEVGDYLIKGSSGFAQEGWYVETPKDANGNVLFSVIYITLENGDISVKTYKKKFDFETVSIVADLENPVDITENRWIDLRLQELPQPEIEELESSTPPEFQPTGLAQAVATVMESYNGTEQ